MGSGTVFSIRFGQKDDRALRECILASFALLGIVTVILNILVFAGTDGIIWFLRTPDELIPMMREYLAVIFAGLIGIFLYNFFASLLRSLGNSVIPLVFLAVSAVLNIILDLWFVAGLNRGVAGGCGGDRDRPVCLRHRDHAVHLDPVPPSAAPGSGHPAAPFPHKRDHRLLGPDLPPAVHYEPGILAVQGLVNSFGTTIMAAFAAAVKIDAFAYLPVQDFGNAFSIFIAQNYGAGNSDRIRKGIRTAVITSTVFSLIISLLVFIFARPLMSLFIDAGETAVITEGVRYLRIEGAFYA